MSQLYRVTIQDPSGSFPYSIDGPKPERESRSGIKAASWPSLYSLPETKRNLETPRRWFEWRNGALTICWDGVDRTFHPRWCFIVIEEMEIPETKVIEPVGTDRFGTLTVSNEKSDASGSSTGNSEPPVFTVTQIPNKVSGYRSPVLTARPAVGEDYFRKIMQAVANEAKADIYLVKLTDSWLVQTDGNRSRDIKKAYLTHAEALRDPEHGPRPSA